MLANNTTETLLSNNITERAHDYGKINFALKNKNCQNAKQAAHQNVLV